MNTGFGAHLALFSEIGMVLLVTTLAGVAAGYWVDQELGTQPLFILGFLRGNKKSADLPLVTRTRGGG